MRPRHTARMSVLAAFTAMILLGILAGSSTPVAPVHAEPADRQLTLIPSLPLQLNVVNTATPTPTRTPTPINIGNLVWDDFDSDGRQDAGEPGLSGITVQLWNGTKTNLIDSDTTDASGHYTVIAPLPGSYRIRVVLPSGSDQFSPKDQAGGDDTDDSDINPNGTSIGFTDIISIASNVISMSNIDAGIIKFRTPTPTRTPTPINIGNFVWDDLDSDGRQDAGEPGLSGVIVQLWNSAKTVMFDDAVTDGNGHYAVIAPLPGSYRIRVVLPGASDQFSPKDQAGGDDTDDSDINATGSNLGFTDVINIASNVISMSNVDAGIIKFRTATPTRTPTPINLGNFVWNDLDQDGQQDAGEAGLAGVTVQLWNSTKTLMIGETVTNGNGNYTLIAPLPGSYRIRVVLPLSSDQFSPKDQAGGDDTDDSDINPSGTNLGFTDVIVIASNVISISNLDAGIIRTITATPTLTPTATFTLPAPIAVGTVGNFVWNDLDHDGVQDAGEPGLVGLTVQLWNPTKTTQIASTTTNALGQYTITAVPGDYRIRVLLANDDDQYSPTDQGSDTFDSDIINGDPSPSNPDAGYTAVFTLSSAQTLVTIDVGIIPAITVQSLQLAPTFTPGGVLINPIPIDVCGSFRLTSPLDGLPNGIATFYWDPAGLAGVNYRIVILDGGTTLAIFGAGQNTNVSGDVSSSAVGGSFQFTVRVQALGSGGQVLCSDDHLLLRASLGAPPQPTPTRRRGAN